MLAPGKLPLHALHQLLVQQVGVLPSFPDLLGQFLVIPATTGFWVIKQENIINFFSIIQKNVECICYFIIYDELIISNLFLIYS